MISISSATSRSTNTLTRPQPATGRAAAGRQASTKALFSLAAPQVASAKAAAVSQADAGSTRTHGVGSTSPSTPAAPRQNVGSRGSQSQEVVPTTTSASTSPAVQTLANGVKVINTGIFLAYEYPAGFQLSSPAPTAAASKAADTTTTPAESTDPVAALSSALTAAGIDPAPFNLTYNEQLVSFPMGSNGLGTGSYWNRQITATMPDGTHEQFDAGLVSANPQVAVVEIARMTGAKLSN